MSTARTNCAASRKSAAPSLLDSYEQLWRARVERLDALLADDA